MHRRAVAVKDYLLRKYPYLCQERILVRPQGEDGMALRQLIEADSAVPDREDALRILDEVTDRQRRMPLLRRLNGGNAYRYIAGHLLPRLRNAAVCVVKMREAGHPELLEATAEGAALLSGSASSSACKGEATFARLRSAALPAPASRRTRPLFALKTNLLFDAALMPNVEIEVPIGNRWSVNGEYMFPWWLMGGNKYCLQILAGGLEGRYWLGSREKRMTREVLTGHFFGLYAGGGKYDLQWEKNGYQGEFFIAAGISYGYARRIARNLHLEFNIGIGLLRTDYRHYHPRENYTDLLWLADGKYTWLGPTKLKLSLVWLLNRKTTKKGGER